MSVQLSPADSSAVNATGQGIASNAVTAAAVAPAQARTALTAGTAKLSWRNGALADDGTLNLQVTGAQQALGFLDQMAAQLQALKNDVSARLAGKPGDASALAGKLANFTAQWNARSSASGGSLDANLDLSGDSGAQVDFRIRGLDFNTLQNGGDETLTFYPGGLGKPGVSVAINTGMDRDALLARLNQALAPSGINATTGDDGELTLSVAEADWPALSSQLMIKGGGIRFPSGQPNRVRAQEQPGAIDPAGWQVDGVANLRRTLQQIVNAIAQVEQARARVKQALAHAMQVIEAAKHSSESQWAAGFASSFGSTLAQQGNYALMSNIAPALIGVSRYRVTSLLSLD